MGVDRIGIYPIAAGQMLQLVINSPGGNQMTRFIQKQKAALDTPGPDTMPAPLH